MTRKRDATAKLPPLHQEALALKEGLMLELKSAPRVVVFNVRQGVERLREELGTLEKAFKGSPGALIDRYAALGEAFKDASLAVEESRPGRNTQLATDLKTARGLRRVLLSHARSAADAGLLPAVHVRSIAKGKGPIDTAKDCVQLVQVFNDNWKAMANKTPVTLAQLKQAADVGTRLLDTLVPRRARHRRPEKLVQATALRDRLYTLLKVAHDQTWPLAAYAFGRDRVDEWFPPLGSRAQKRRKKKTSLAATG